MFLTLLIAVPLLYAAVPAPTGFDNLTNGFENQMHFDADRAQFETLEQIETGLGPTYNAQACSECHQNPVSGSASQITEVRAGQTSGGIFTDHTGGLPGPGPGHRPRHSRARLRHRQYTHFPDLTQHHR